MKNNLSPNDLVVHPHYNESKHQYDIKIGDVADGLTKAGYKIDGSTNSDNKKNWWEDKDLADKIAYRLEIHRDNGDFKTSPITLSVKLFCNNNDITDSVPADNFLWTRTSGNTEVSRREDKHWNESHSAGSKSIIISREDVNLHAQFSVSFVKYEDDTEWLKKLYDSYIQAITKDNNNNN